MPKINPHDSWLPLDQRYRDEPDDRMRTLLKAVRDHMEHEIKGDIAPLMATLTAAPVYHFWGNTPFVLSGRAAVEAFYLGMFTAGGNQFEVVIDTITADRANVITQGQVKQVHTGRELAAQGRKEVNGKPFTDSDLFLSIAQLITVWPGDADGRLVGEDIYFGDVPLSRLEPITVDDLPAGYRWQHRV